MFQVEVFWVVTPCSVVHPEDGGSKVLRNVGILPHGVITQDRLETSEYYWVVIATAKLYYILSAMND
jgi:hypothetical protein